MWKEGIRDPCTTTDTGLNSSDIRPGSAEVLFSPPGKTLPLTPLASFSAEDLSHVRHTVPDAYHALLQYEQLCRHSAATLEAREMELQRCIAVGREVLGRLDDVQGRCLQLAKERDGALAKLAELQQRVKRVNDVQPSGAVDVSQAAAQKHPEASENFLRERRLEKKLQEQQRLHDTLQRDLHNAVHAARKAGSDREAAESARRSVEGTLAEVRARLGEKEQEVLRSVAAQREAERLLKEQGKELERVLLQQRDLQKPSADILAAAAQLATTYNQLQDIIQHARRCDGSKRKEGKNQKLLLPVFTQAARLRVPTAGSNENVADRSVAAAQLEQWFVSCLEEIAQLVPELSRLLYHVEEAQQRCESDYEASKADLLLAVRESHDLRVENERLRDALITLREEVRVLDAQTELLRDIDAFEASRKTSRHVARLEEGEKNCKNDIIEHATFRRELEQVRRQSATELAVLQGQLEAERHTMSSEISSLRAELRRLREGANCASETLQFGDAKRAEVKLKQQLQDESNEKLAKQLELENQRLRSRAVQDAAEIARLGQKIREERIGYDRRVEELQREKEQIDAAMAALRSDHEAAKKTREAETLLCQRREVEFDLLARNMAALEEGSAKRIAELTTENDNLKLFLKQSEHGGDEAAEQQHTKRIETEDATIAALTRELCDAKIEAAKLQDALYRLSQKTKDLTASKVSVDIYEQVETELLQEREQVQELVHSRAVLKARVEELEAELHKQRQCVQDCLRLLSLSPDKEFARVAVLMQTVAEKAIAQLLFVVDESNSVSIPSLSSLCDEANVVTPHPSVDNTTPPSMYKQFLESQSVVSPLPTLVQPCTTFNRQPTVQNAEETAGAVPSPPAMRVSDELLSRKEGILKQQAVACAFSTALQVFLGDLATAIEQLLLQSYTDLWEALEKLALHFSFSVGDINDTHNTQHESKESDDKNCNTNASGNIASNPVFADEKIILTPKKNTEKDAVWIAVVSGIIGTYVDACAAVFFRLHRVATNYWKECEDDFQRTGYHTNASCEERVRRAVSEVMERERTLSLQLETTKAKAVLAQRSADEAQSMLQDMTSRYHDVCARAVHLEERLASRQREWETERKQWCDTVAELQSESGALRQGGEEERVLLCRQVKELQEAVQLLQEKLRDACEKERQTLQEAENNMAAARRETDRLERELEEARASRDRAEESLREMHAQLMTASLELQLRHNDDMSRGRQAEMTIELLRDELRDAHGAQQALHRSFASEAMRCEAVESRLEELGRMLTEQRTRADAQEQRAAELQGAWLLQERTLEVVLQETEALRKINRVLEERLAEVEGDREPLRQQLQSLLMLKPK